MPAAGVEGTPARVSAENRIAALASCPRRPSSFPEWLKEQWAKNLGVDTTITTLERATYIAERNQGNYQITAGGWGADYPDPQNWLPLFRTGGALNSGNFSNADFDALIDEAATELDNGRRLDLYRRAQIVMMDEAPFAPLNYRNRSFLAKPWVQGLALRGDDFQPGDRNYQFVSIQGRQ